MAGTDRGTDGTTAALPAADVTVQLSARSLVAIGGAVLVAIAIVGLVGPTRDTLVRIAIGLVLALALDPLVCALQRRGLTRRRAAAAIGVAAVAVVGLVIVLVGPATIDQANRFEEELPQMAEGFYDLPLVGDTLRERDAAGRLEDLVADLPARVDDRTVSDTAESLLGGALTALIVLAVAFGVMLDGDRLVDRVRRLIPDRHRSRADDYGRVLYRTFGSYFGGSVTVAVLNGLYILVVGLALDVPLAPIAAGWAMVTNLIPQIGGFLGGSFLTVLALSVSVPTGLLAAVLFILYMNLENHVIQPAIVGQAVDLSPPTTMMAALIGGAAAGVPGALVATPIVGATKRIYLQVRGTANPEPDEHPSLGDRVRRILRR